MTWRRAARYRPRACSARGIPGPHRCAYGLYVADRLPDYDPDSEYAWGPRPLALQLQHDRSWYQPGAAGIHPLLVHMSSYSHENDDLRGDRLSLERPAARPAAAMFRTTGTMFNRMKEVK